VKVESTTVFIKFSCEDIYELACSPLRRTIFYCIKGCIKKQCHKGFPVAVPDCNSSCGLINSIDINTGIYFFTKSFSLWFYSYYVKLGQIMILNVLCNELYLTDPGDPMTFVVNSSLQECEKKK